MLVTLPPHLGPVLHLASKGEARFTSTTGIRVVDPHNGLYRVEATNGRYLGVFQGPAEPCPASLEDRDHNADRRSAIVPGEQWKELFKGGKEPVTVITDGDDGALVLARGKAMLTLHHSREVDGRWPPVDQVIPGGAPLWQVAVDPGLLIKLLQAAQAVTDDETRRVYLAGYGRRSGLLLGVVANNRDGHTFDGILVPLGEAPKTPSHQSNGHTPPPAPAETPDDEPGDDANDDDAGCPLLRTYREAKARHPGMLLLFRMGDFYELFDRDAEQAATVLGLTVTTRTSGGQSVSTAGFPHRQLEAYLAKLLQLGHRVAVCDDGGEHEAAVPPAA